MKITMKQISSLHKIRKTDKADIPEISCKTALAGERFSYQIYLEAEALAFVTLSVDSELKDYVRVYSVKDAVMDAPVTRDVPQEDYITLEPGLMPDILIPLEDTNNQLTIDGKHRVLWVKVDIPRDVKSGNYSVCVKLKCVQPGGGKVETFSQCMDIHVMPVAMPEQKLIYTRWMYLDCIAAAHNVPIFSDKHWELIEQYISAAADVGINMLLVPVHTPPLDTEIGMTRPCVQLVDIEKNGDIYSFDFQRFHRYITLCKKCGIRYYEIAHMFSQWGAKWSPNILISENGIEEYKFGWNVAADDPSYISFLKQYIVAIRYELEKEAISEYTFFHISDEPTLESMEDYRAKAEIIRPLIGNCKTMDAISDYVFYEQGLIECPVTIINNIHTFLDHNAPNQWVYYCGLPQSIFPNSFMAAPSYRIRILGFLLYRYGIQGFLHWGFNFYNACCSVYHIDPYITTSCDGVYPSGDPFIVYPGENTVYSSVRGEIMYEAIQDMDVCVALEQKIGRDDVVKTIDKAFGGQLRFDNYPRNMEFVQNLRSKMIQMLL